MSRTYRRRPPKNIEDGLTYRDGPRKSRYIERTVKNLEHAQHIAEAELRKRTRTS